MPHRFAPGTVITWIGKHDDYRGLVCIVGDRVTSDCPLTAWKYTKGDDSRWNVHSKGHVTWADAAIAKVITGDEADRVLAEYTAAVLTDDIVKLD